MKFIAPLEIASKIMTLIVEAEKELILVSPYIEIYDWSKMKKSLSKAVNKGICINFIVRQNASNDLSPLLELNIKPILIRDLHAKVYINDKYAIVTSQNIIQYSDTNSIDVGYITENEKERVELLDFVNNYIKNINPIVKNVKIIESNTIVKPKEIFQKVESQNHEEKKQLTDFEIEELYRFFWINFPLAKVKKAATYLFCENLLPFADVMIDSKYVIKIKKTRTDCELILKKIEVINFSYHHTFKVELLNTHKSFYYLDFVPQGEINLDKLIEDYFHITSSILKSDFIKTLKV
jgi:hypothetical protein